MRPDAKPPQVICRQVRCFMAENHGQHRPALRTEALVEQNLSRLQSAAAKRGTHPWTELNRYRGT